MSRIQFLPLLLLTAGLAAPAQDFQELLKKTTDFTLTNGMRFVVVERHDAPNVAARVYVRAGAVNDPPGQAGLARMFERALLTGPETVGSRDAPAERKALEAIEEIRTRIDAERGKGTRADEGRLAAMRVELSRANAQANGLGNATEFTQALSEGGITSTLNVGSDATTWDWAMPSNRTELWFVLQAQELQRPSFRHFYDERDELANTWRGRVENSPFANAMATLPAEAFLAHPYRKPVQGWASDVAELRMSEARQFFDRNWTPGNITVALCGDITAAEARRLAERYFGAIPTRPPAAPLHTQEPEQKGPRTVLIENSPQALLAIGYKRPDLSDKDDLALDVVRSILVAGRTAWLTKELVDTKRIATSVQAQPSFPGPRYPNLFVVVAGVAPGHTADEVEKAVTDVIGRLQNARVDEATLERARAATRRALVSRLNDNVGLAGILARAAAEYGDWRRTFELFDAVDKVTAEQVQIASLKHLTPAHRTSVHVNPPPPAPVRGGGQ